MYSGSSLPLEMMKVWLFMQQCGQFADMLDAMLTTSGHYGTINATMHVGMENAGVSFYKRVNIPAFPTARVASNPLVAAMKDAEFRVENKSGETPLYTRADIKWVTGYPGGVRIASPAGDFSVAFSGMYGEFDRLIAWVMRLRLDDEHMSFHHVGYIARNRVHKTELVRDKIWTKGLDDVPADVPGQERVYAPVRDDEGKVRWMVEVVYLPGEENTFDEDIHFDLAVTSPDLAVEKLQTWIPHLHVERLATEGPGPRWMVSVESGEHNARLSFMFRAWDDRTWLPSGIPATVTPE
jgi:hypothetical protein